MIITFEELRNIKDRLPHGGIQQIADNLGMDVKTVRNYFGGAEEKEMVPAGVHMEQGSHGGYVRLDDMRIYEAAMSLIA